MNDDLIVEIADSAVGTTDSVQTLMERYEIDMDASDFEYEMAMCDVQICPGCGWWDRTEDPDGYCEECLNDMDTEDDFLNPD